MKLPSAKTAICFRKEAWDPICHYHVIPFFTGHSLGVEQFKFGDLKLTIYKKGIIICGSQGWRTFCLSLGFFPIPGSHWPINMAFGGIQLPDFPFCACLLFLLSLYQISHSTPHLSTLSRIILQKRCVLMYLYPFCSIFFLIIVHFHFVTYPFLGNTILYSIKWTFATQPNLYINYHSIVPTDFNLQCG